MSRGPPEVSKKSRSDRHHFFPGCQPGPGSPIDASRMPARIFHLEMNLAEADGLDGQIRTS
jgi:hypothetical protein